MKTVVLNMLFFLSVSAQFGKHFYVGQLYYDWHQAQKYCRDHFTDLSPLSTSRDEPILRNAVSGTVSGRFWTGLYRNGTQWMWSGGGHVTHTQWDYDEPDNITRQKYGVLCWIGCNWSGWHNTNSKTIHFFCFNLIVIETKKSWERAMWHCKNEHTILTSLASETENLLALSEIQHDHITERVWIGLRYLGDLWLWMDGDPLQYEAWHQGGDQDHQCPSMKRCGALTKKGVWENRDCQEKLNFICY